MIQKGFFPEGHLDRQETCLMTDHETYQQYLIAQQGYDRRTEAEKAEAQAEKNRRDAEQNRNDAGSRENLSSECRALLEEGKRYIRHIHECNDRIPGQEISEKLDRLEQVVTRIFNEVERRPELAPELRKMMSYYLPTTQKLLDAYCEMDAQQIQGQNIDMTKREIEDALDTINKAFENLLDGFFEHTAWDISSDISVLHTMFAQEGLTGQEFRQEK
jgi:5-bromo-4-chloroindolyl phosphate hydrolysis protein